MIDPHKAKPPYQMVSWTAFKATSAYREVVDALTRNGYRIIIIPAPAGFSEDRVILEMVNAEKAGK